MTGTSSATRGQCGATTPPSCRACNPLVSPPAPGSCPPLAETWSNASAPLYAKETLGWGGRLSGPNDGAVDTNAAVQRSSGGLTPFTGRYAMSSCMSCHGPAEYRTESFLLPVSSTCEEDSCIPETATCSGDSCTADPNGNRLVYFAAGSTDFMNWIQDRPGTVPQYQGSTALLITTWSTPSRVFPAWFEGTDQSGTLKYTEQFNDYRGLTRELAKVAIRP